MSRISARTTSKAKQRWPGRWVLSVARWAAICLTAFSLFCFACLIDIMGVGGAFVGNGILWLMGMGIIVLTATIALLAIWVALDLWNGLVTEIQSLNPLRWTWRRPPRSGVWDKWLDDPHPFDQPKRAD
jgi:hypothetical protein